MPGVVGATGGGGVDVFDGVDGGGFDGVEWWFGGLVASTASMVGVDGGLGSSTQRALTWKSLCVPSGEDGAHSSSLFFV